MISRIVNRIYREILMYGDPSSIGRNSKILRPVSHVVQKHFDTLILVATSTEEKIVQYNAIARAKDMPLQFRRLNELVEAFHSAPEDCGDRKKNAGQKFSEIDNEIEQCRIKDSSYQRILREKCEEWGIEYFPEKIFFCTEDSTIDMDKRIWKQLRKKLSLFVPEELLSSADKNGSATGPGAETGPILAAVGFARFFNLYREAVCEAGEIAKDSGEEALVEPVIVDYVTCVLTALSDLPKAPATYIDAKANLRIFFREGIGRPIREPDVIIAQSACFYCQPDCPGEPVVEDFDRFLVNNSARSIMVEKIFEHAKKNAKDFVLERDDCRIYCPSISAVNCEKDMQAKIRKINYVDPAFSGDLKDFYSYLNLQPMIDGSDAFVFSPFSTEDEALVRYHNFRLFSAMVAKQLDSSSMYKPIIVTDDGSWTPSLELCFHLANMGMNKDFPRTPLCNGVGQMLRVDQLSHFSTCYFDIIWTKNAGSGMLASAERAVLRHRLAGYHKFKSPEDLNKGIGQGGSPKDEELFSAAVFISASSDNLTLLNDAGDFGKFLAEEGMALVWGAGDRHSMGAPYFAYKKADGPHVSGYSTPLIIKAETKNERMPDCDFWKLCPDIFMRMADMIEASDVICVFPGGAGTAQELLAALVLKDMMPERMFGKSLVIYNTDLHRNSDYPGKPFWNPAIKAFMGDEFLRNISTRHDFYRDQGIYMAADPEELKGLVKELSLHETMPAPAHSQCVRAEAFKRIIQLKI